MATVTVVFTTRPEVDAARPEDVAEALLDHDQVSTVRVNDHGAGSGYRVDVAAATCEDAGAQAADIAYAVAAHLGLAARIVSVGVVRDRDRVEIYRTGQRGEDLVWGER